MRQPLRAYSVGARLKQAREASGLSRRALATLSSVGESTIAHIESGSKQPRGDTVELLAIALKVDMCWLAYGIGKAQKSEKD
jgi:transcriptional regulator with XRE-family HTH domain